MHPVHDQLLPTYQQVADQGTHGAGDGHGVRDDLHAINPIHHIGRIPVDAVVMRRAEPISADDRVLAARTAVAPR